MIQYLKMPSQVNGHFLHSNLIVGGTLEERERTALELAKAQAGIGKSAATAADLIEIRKGNDKNSLSIEEIKELQSQLRLKPYRAKFKAVVIYEAQKATIEAQNCLLKTLEEPPAHSLLFLTAPETESLLPTIVSRCRVIDLGSRIAEPVINQSTVDPGIDSILALSAGKKLDWVEENKETVTEKEALLSLLDRWLSATRQLMLTTAEPDHYRKAAALILTYKKDLATTNVSPRLALETLLLSLPVI